MNGLLVSTFVVSSVVLSGCGAAQKQPASAPTPYDWSDYKGTFAQGPEDRTVAEAPKAKPKSEEKGDASTGASSTKVSKGTIQGESVSSVSVDAVTNASKTMLKSKVVSSDVIVGAEYEQVQVVMKGVAVQIIRPAANPDKAGPKVRSPKARNGGLLKTESGWYDADANVLVLVRATKKASSLERLL